MSKQLEQLVAPVRDKFVEAYTLWVAEMAQQFDEGVCEHPFKIASNPNLMRQLYRVDFAVSLKDQPEFREFKMESMLGFQPATGPLDGMTLHLHPFRWDGAVVQIDGAVWDETGLEQWFERWFGLVMGAPIASARGQPSGRIHAVVREGQALHIDFGSAPVAALGELAELARRSGVAHFGVHDATLLAQQQAGGGQGQTLS
ncbi:hypothetical protein [Maricaulis sp. CAU 1757]